MTVEPALPADSWFRAIFAAVPQAVLLLDGARRVVLVNPRAEALFGYPAAELQGQELARLVSAQDKLTAQHLARTKDGAELAVDLELSPLETAAGRHTLAFVRDATPRAALEAEAQRTREDFADFSHIVAHDLQEPLRMVVSFSELIAERYQSQLDERADKYIAYVLDGARRIQQLVGDLLTYSRVGSQGQPLAPVSSQEVVRSVLALLRAALQQVEVEVEPLPIVLADPAQLAQLFQSLIGNSVKFRGTEPLRLEIRASREQGSWRFSLKDNGIGIERQHAERVFQIFQRLHERGKYEGTGIGLAIAKRIVERHRGRIWFESEPGRGATFFFTLQPVAE